MPRPTEPLARQLKGNANAAHPLGVAKPQALERARRALAEAPLEPDARKPPNPRFKRHAEG